MSASEISDLSARPRRQWSTDWIVALLIFLATAAVIVWQNSRLAVIWDLSYILENSFRISLGDVPYRDFPFPYPPLTFLIQAALIRLTGRAFWHHVGYCVLTGGFAGVLTWRILLNSLRTTAHPRLLAFLLSLPLIPLGIYCIFPHPFYDPDCTFTILLGLLLLQRLDRKPSWWLALVTGALLVVPLFIKQNTGLAFLVSTSIALLILILLEAFRRKPVRHYLLTLGGVGLGLVLALLLIKSTAGLANYWHWTIQFAASRRAPPLAEMIGVYRDKTLLLWLALILAGAFLLWLSRRGNRALMILSAFLIAVPFLWPAIYLLREHDASERAERLLTLWPLLIIISFVAAVLAIKRRNGISLVLPLILIGVINGAFMSQQLWGSTYAIWPLFVILLATTIAALSSLAKALSRIAIPVTAAIVASLLICSVFYLRSHERLDYANLDDGALTRSTLPQLRGLATRGDWLPNFEELVRYTEREIPRDQPILIIPGEDLFYYTTGRRPQFPVLMFDHTVNPYTPEEILKLARDRNIRWLIIKQDLQDEDEQVEQERDRLTEVLEQEFEQTESLKNYDIYKRKNPGEEEEDDDDKPGQK
jgi:hypothetical protein